MPLMNLIKEIRKMVGAIGAQPVPVPKIVYVIFTAQIDPKTAEGLLGVMANCATQGVKSVYLALSTPGGDVVQGIALYNALRGMR